MVIVMMVIVIVMMVIVMMVIVMMVMVMFMVMVMTHGMLAGNIPIYRNDILYIRRQQSIHWM
jgi:hypothetical protein